MKRIRVNKGFVGLVFKNDDYQRIVTAGKHWLNFGEEVRYCNKAKLFGSEVALEVFLEDEHFRAQIELIEVPDGCLTLVFQNGNYWLALEESKSNVLLNVSTSTPLTRKSLSSVIIV